MKNVFLVLFSMILFLSSCDKDSESVLTCESCNFTCLDENEPNLLTNACINDWTCSFKIMRQSAVELEETLGISVGSKNTFRMLKSTEGEVDIADDEITEVLVFELDPSQNSFSVEDSELANMNVHYRRICFCPDANFKPITEGCLQGEKQTDGTWIVQGYFGEGFEFGLDVQFEN